MALRSITIENFKCIGDAVTIPIRPITLLFGKNSSGKSTVLQALLYMRELLLRFHQNDKFVMRSGDFIPLKNIPIDLGDFPSLVHRHDLNRKIRIRLGFDESFCQSYDLSFEIAYDSAAIELVVSWDETQRMASVESYIYALNGEDFFYVLNEKGKSYQTDKGQQLDPIDTSCFQTDRRGKPLTEGYLYFINKNSSIIKKAEEVYKEDNRYSVFLKIARGPIIAFTNYIRRELNSTRYLGPIREVPPRNYLISQRSNESRWATGLEAWDAAAQDAVLAEKVNRYAQKLELGYSFLQSDRVFLDMDSKIMKNLRTICSSDENIEVDRLKRQVLYPLERLHRQHPILLRDENSGIEVHPLDVGFGISQVFPVLVGALDQGHNSPKIFAVEQPELHVHPALQVGLGDLFIDGIRNRTRTMLIETHSEHLLLRLLRRVRETNVRNSKKYEWQQSSMTPLVREMSEAAIRDSENQDSQDHRLTPDDLSVVYVRPTPEGIKFTPISVTDDGDFYAPWPEGFFDERVKELF